MRIRQRAFVDISNYKTKEDYTKLFNYIQFLGDDNSNEHIMQFIDDKLCIVPMEIMVELEE